MTAPPTTPLAVVRHLTALADELRATTGMYRKAERDAVTKRHTADQIEARAFLEAQGSVDFRKNTAKVAADHAENEASVAEALVRVLKAEMRSLEQQISIGQTTARVEGNPMLAGGA